MVTNIPLRNTYIHLIILLILSIYKYGSKYNCMTINYDALKQYIVFFAIALLFYGMFYTLPFIQVFTYAIIISLLRPVKIICNHVTA